MSNDALKTLHTALVDAEAGYVTAARDATNPAFVALFNAMIGVHGGAHRELHEALVQSGADLDDGGSFMSVVHQAVIGVRAVVTGLDRGALASFASGEERLIDDYDAAIEEARTSPSVLAMLMRQKLALLDQIATMRAMAGQ